MVKRGQKSKMSQSVGLFAFSCEFVRAETKERPAFLSVAKNVKDLVPK